VLYPVDHPYSWSVYGSMADLSRASRDDVGDFFRRYYHPANASLCLAGDFQPAQAKALIERYFGPIPAGPAVAKVEPWRSVLAEEQRLTMVDRVSLPRLYFCWPTVDRLHADEPALRMLDEVLSGTKTSRLQQALVRQQQIAQNVYAYQHSSEMAGEFNVVATARPGHTLAELEASIMAEIRRVQAEPPAADELARAVTRFEAATLRELESVGGFGGKADRLNRYNVFYGDPGYLAQDFEQFARVTPADVHRVAQKYLGSVRVVLEVSPGTEKKVTHDPRPAADEARDKLGKSAPSAATAAAAAIDEQPWHALPKPGAAPQFRLPPLNRARLSNGLDVVVIENHELPTVALTLMFEFGKAADPANRLGLTGMLAAVWDEGTQNRTAEQISDELAGQGGSLSVDADWDTTALRMSALKRRLPGTLDVFADVLLHPAFPPDEVQRETKKALASLMQLRDDATSLAYLAVPQIVYGSDHPYGRPGQGTPATLAAIAPDDLAAHYRRHVAPQGATLIAAGDVTLSELVPLLEQRLADWKGRAPEAAQSLPAPTAEQPTRIVLVDKPGSAQSVIAVCRAGAVRKTPDYYPISLLNTMLGGQFMSRLNLNLREDKGYTYGARSAFDWRARQTGAFWALASVQTAVTAKAVVEFLKEIDGLAGARPAGAAELADAKAWLTAAYPGDFETPGQVVRQVETLVKYRLDDDYFDTYVDRVRHVAAADVARVGKERLNPERLTIVVVGDRSQVEKSLQELPAGKNLEIRHFDDNFRLTP